MIWIMNEPRQGPNRIGIKKKIYGGKKCPRQYKR